MLVRSWFSVLHLPIDSVFQMEDSLGWQLAVSPFKLWTSRRLSRTLQNGGEVQEIEFGVPSGEKVNKSEDPFGIYSLLQKNKTNMENKVNEEDHSLISSPPLPLRKYDQFEGNNDSNSVNNNVEPTDLDRSKLLRSGGSILNFMEEVVKEEGFFRRSAFTGVIDQLPEMSKLESNFRSENLLTSCPNISAITVQKNQASEISQKAKIKWAIEGDENVKFFHGILNKKRNQSQIRGVMANEDRQIFGKWAFILTAVLSCCPKKEETMRNILRLIYRESVQYGRWRMMGSFSVASIRKDLERQPVPGGGYVDKVGQIVPIKVNNLAGKVKIKCTSTRFNISRRGMDIDTIELLMRKFLHVECGVYGG
ncbi:hypothetical protein Tco_1394183 [Tanacetum coccineum]